MSAPPDPRVELTRSGHRAVLLCLGIAAAALYELWLLGQMPIRGDAGAYFAPLRLVLASALQEGQLLGWNSLHDGGASLWSNPQAQALYPPGVLSALVSPLGTLGLLTALHLLGFAAGCLLLLRGRGMTHLAAAPAVLCVSLSGVLLSVAAMQDKLHSLAWIPWLLLGITHCLDGRRTGKLLILISLPAALLAGGVDVLVLCAPLGAALAWEARSEPARRERLSSLWGWLGLAVGLCALQWVPLLALLAESSFSEGADSATLLARALRPGDLLGLLAPNVGYQAETSQYLLPWEETARALWIPGIYLGGGGLLFLAVGALGARQSGEARAAVGFLIFFLLLALGPLVPGIGWLLTELPIVSSIRYPQKWLIPALFPAAFLMASGATRLREQTLPGGRKSLAALLLAGGLLLVVGGTSDQPQLSRTLGLLGQACLAAGGAGLLWTTKTAPRQNSLAALAAIAVIGGDLWAHNLPLLPRVEPASFWQPPPIVEALEVVPEDVRLWTWSYMATGRDPAVPPEAPLPEVLRDNLFSGYGAAFGFSLPYGWLSFHPDGVEAYFSAVNRLPAAERVEALRRAGITHLLVHFRDEAQALSQLEGVVPLAMVPGGWNAIALFGIVDPYPMCRLTPLDTPGARGRALETTDDRGSSFRVALPEGAVGRVSCLQPWSSGWQADRGGRALTTEASGGFQLSTVLDEATDEPLSFQYQTPGARTGSALSLASLLALVALLARRRKPSDDE